MTTTLKSAKRSIVEVEGLKIEGDGADECQKALSSSKTSPGVRSERELDLGRYLTPENESSSQKVGLDPRRIATEDLRALGHPTSPAKAIRAKCLDCCCGSPAEVSRCHIIDCPLWAFRMGRNVYHSKSTIE
jgi:hypothetical protein